MSDNRCDTHGFIGCECDGIIDYKKEIDRLRTELEELKKERWNVVATRNAAINRAEAAEAELKQAEQEIREMQIERDGALNERNEARQCEDRLRIEVKKAEAIGYQAGYKQGVEDLFCREHIDRLTYKEFSERVKLSTIRREDWL